MRPCPRINSDHSTAISSADGAEVLKKLDNLAKKYQEKPNRPHTFIGDVAEALGINMPNKSSKYGTYETMSGDVVTIRLSNHNATISERGEEVIAFAIEGRLRAGEVLLDYL